MKRIIRRVFSKRNKSITHKEEIFDPRLERVPFSLEYLTCTPDGVVIGAMGSYKSGSGTLCRIIPHNSEIERVYIFEEPINAIHCPSDSEILVATDSNWWDKSLPCTLYYSNDSGRSFSMIKQFYGPSILWWSIASSRHGDIYVGEYGPKEPGLCNHVWKVDLTNETWSVVFEAPPSTGTHIHRVAVDPYTDELWVSYGDIQRETHYRDHTGAWHLVAPIAATGFAFTPEAVYLGADTSVGRIFKVNRSDFCCTLVFSTDKHNIPAGGSVYDMIRGESGTIYVPFKKYPKQHHAATLWAGKETNWQCLMVMGSKSGEASGGATIAGPDKEGFVYIPGYRFKECNYTE